MHYYQKDQILAQITLKKQCF